MRIISSKLQQQKNIVISYGICSILGRIRIQNQTRIRIHHPGSGSADPDTKRYGSETLILLLQRKTFRN